MIAAYPRKGTITVDVSSECILHERIAAYPRKGTITSHQSARRTTCTDCSLSPQGDDNIIIVIYMQSPFIAAYPRKGAKNSASKDAEFFFYKP